MPKLVAAIFTSFLIPILSMWVSIPICVLLLWGLKKNSLVFKIIVSFFRSTPLIAQLFFTYYGLSQFGFIHNSFLWTFFREAFFCVILVFSFNAASHLAFFLRNLTSELDKELLPAARALHLSRLQYWRYLLVPQTLKQADSVLQQEFIMLFKAGSISSLVALTEFSSITKNYMAETFDAIGAYSVGLCFYFFSVFLIQKSWRFLVPRIVKAISWPHL